MDDDLKAKLSKLLADKLKEMAPGAKVETLPGGGVVVLIYKDQRQASCDCAKNFKHIDITGLNDKEVHALMEDIIEICEGEMPEAPRVNETFNKGEEVLLQRIGGQAAVLPYVAVLMAGLGYAGTAKIAPAGRPS